MAITDRTRKILWARSGSRCAFCRVPLIIDKTPQDFESVIGEECHIVSPASGGPRHSSDLAPEKFDGLENLILLCAIHHKMIDDQFETYTVTLVDSIKSNHERWVEDKLKDDQTIPPVRIRRVPKNVPVHLLRFTSGKLLLAEVANTMGHYFDHEDDLEDGEVELVGGFLQELSDWADISQDIEALERVRAAKRMQELLDDLTKNSFFVFAAREVQRVEGGVGPPHSFPVIHVTVMRASNPTIVKFDADAGPPA